MDNSYKTIQFEKKEQAAVLTLDRPQKLNAFNLRMLEEMLDAIKYVNESDDIEFLIGNYPIKKFGSQGQQKSFLIALKLAQYEVLKAKSGNSPILLLDDIFDKLDSKRVKQIIKMVNDSNFGQLFISDTDAKRTENVVKSAHDNYEIFKL